MENDLGFLPTEFLCIFYSTLGHVAQKSLVSIVAGSFADLQDHRTLGLGCCLYDSLELLHVVEVESRDGVTAVDGLRKHLAGVDKA